MKLEGVYTALVTPMTADGALDEKALRRLVDFQVEGGVSGLVPVGTTGESPTLDGEECKRVIQIVVEQARGRVPVIAGAGSNSHRARPSTTRRTRRRPAPTRRSRSRPTTTSRPTRDSSATSAPSRTRWTCPSWSTTSPGRTGKNIDNPTMLELAQHRNIVAVKEASGDIGQIMDLIAKKPAGFTVLSGDDNLVFPIMALGGTGVISVASNLVPDADVAVRRAPR